MSPISAFGWMNKLTGKTPLSAAHLEAWNTFLGSYTDERAAAAQMAAEQASSAQLLYAPPQQSNPTVVSAATIGTGFFTATFDANEDVILQLPPTRKSSMVIIGGNDVRVGPCSINNTENQGAPLVFQKTTGSVFLEGLDVNMTSLNNDVVDWGGRQLTDANGPTYPDLYIQNCRFYNVHGSLGTTHADIVQAQGPVGRLFVDKLTGSSNYQGFQLAPQKPITSVSLSRVNLSYTGPGEEQEVTYLLWFLDNESQTPYPVTLNRVYVNPRSGQTVAANAVWPNSAQTGFGAYANPDGTVTWPANGPMQVAGVVTPGVPPNGDFVPANSVGAGYVSPGYQGQPLSTALPAAAQALPWEDQSIVSTFDWRGGSAAAALAANQARGGRVRIPKSGKLQDLAIYVGVQSGNVSAGIYDVGQTTSGTRTRLYTTGAITCPATGTQIVGSPELDVTQGQYLEFWLAADNATATFTRATPSSVSLPSSYPAPPGGLSSPNAFAPVQGTAQPLPATLPGTLTAGGTLPLITARIA